MDDETPVFDELVKEMDEEHCDFPECTRSWCLLRRLKEPLDEEEKGQE